MLTYLPSDQGVVADLARRFVETIRTWSSTPFLNAMSSRPETERMEVVEELFRRLEAKVKAEPMLYQDKTPRVTIVVRKVQE